MEKMLKKEKGITLIALIITVIVLLILAGTAISISINGGDIFSKASSARESWNHAVEEEQAAINSIFSILDNDIFYSNRNIPTHTIVGFWSNWIDQSTSDYDAIKLSEISNKYDVINIAFARNNSTQNNGSVEFSLNSTLSSELNYSENQFKTDIMNLQASGKKVLISVGGDGGSNIPLTSDTNANNFAQSLITIINEYGLNGVDFDIETAGNSSFDLTYFEKAVEQIYNHYSKNIMLTLCSSCTEMRAENAEASHTEQIWHKCASDLKDIFTIVSCRYYNSGSQIGYDFPDPWSRSQGNVSFITSQVVKWLNDDKLNNDTIGMTILSSASEDTASPSGYMTEDKIVLALQSIIEGDDPEETTKNFVPDKAYPNFKAVSVWSINYDHHYNYKFVNAIKQYLNSL